MGFELTALVMIGTDLIGSCKSNYHTITTNYVQRKRYLKFQPIRNNRISHGGHVFSVDQDEMRIHINTIPPEFRSSSFIDDKIGKSQKQKS